VGAGNRGEHGGVGSHDDLGPGLDQVVQQRRQPERAVNDSGASGSLSLIRNVWPRAEPPWGFSPPVRHTPMIAASNDIYAERGWCVPPVNR